MELVCFIIRWKVNIDVMERVNLTIALVSHVAGLWRQLVATALDIKKTYIFEGIGIPQLLLLLLLLLSLPLLLLLSLSLTGDVTNVTQI